jgi:ceramide glucosyltransferase
MLDVIGGLALFLAAGYSLCALFAVWAGLKAQTKANSPRPPVTILKPLCGAEPHLYECLRSFCIQDYPDFQIVFGLHDAADPALATVRRLRDEFPALDIAIVVNGFVAGPNRKAGNLSNMMAAARHDCLVIADSDIRVGPDYLARVTAPLADPKVGLVTCLYRARPLGGLWSRLGGLFIDDWFVPSVLISHRIGSHDFAFGSTLALRRTELTAIGGFTAIANHLADDYMLGALTRGLGLRTVLSDYVVETIVYESSLHHLLDHELRWMHTIRSLAPLRYNLTFITTCTLPLAVVGIVLSDGKPVTWALLGLTVLARGALHMIQARRSKTRLWPGLALLPVHECLTAYAWARAFLRSQVHWRGQRYTVTRGGFLQRIMDKE